MLVSTEWLVEHLADPGLVVLDMRWREDGSARAAFEAGHVPGARFLDWSSDIVDADHPTAFMLAPPARFAAAMEGVGVGDDVRVVAYADRGGSGPFRLWWAFRRYGHDGVLILDGGFDKWKAEGRTVVTDAPSIEPVRWTPREERPLVATGDDVLAAAGDPSCEVLDSRPAAQFRGEQVWFESGPVPADGDGIARTPRGEVRAGRVPWARSVPWSDLYRPDHTMRSPGELRERFRQAGVNEGTRCITYCGVGISASALLFALHRAGVTEAMLYDGSWEEWGRDPSRPVARG